MSERFCATCEHMRRGGDYGSAYWKCAAVTYLDPVSGETKPVHCGIERAACLGACGVAGKLWTEKAVQP